MYTFRCDAQGAAKLRASKSSAKTECSSKTKGKQFRIPSALQKVFLQSNAGKEVDQAPERGIAHKVFYPKHKLNSKILQDEPNIQKPKTLRKKTSTCPSMSVQAYVDTMLKSRGYSTKHYKTLETAYYNRPTRHQMDSYNQNVIALVRTRDYTSFETLLPRINNNNQQALSTNPCNAQGESLLHYVCRRGDVKMLQIMIQHGAVVQVSDDFGRTPLHDACWSPEPNLDVVELLIQQDPNLLFMEDVRGATPLNYLSRDHWDAWLQWLARKNNVLFPRVAKGGGPPQVPELCRLAPNSRPIPDPCLETSDTSIDLDATQVTVASTVDDDESESEDDDEDDDDDFSLHEQEMSELLNLISSRGSSHRRSASLSINLSSLDVPVNRLEI